MNAERIEETLLVIIALLMLSYLVQRSITAEMITTLALALLLISLLIMRSIAWHKDGITPFDGIMIIGIAITVAYIASLAMLSENALNAIVLLLFACFFSFMAVMLFQHRNAPVHPRVRKLRTWRVKPQAEFKKGIEPIPERPPRWYRRAFTRAPHAQMQPLAEHAPRWYNRTLPQSTTRHAHASAHTSSFKSGMEPIPEITPEHLHKLGVYDAAPKRKR